MRPGGIYRVNEHGEELFAPSAPGTIIPATASRRLMATANDSGRAANDARPTRGGDVHVGAIHIHGANDPHATALAVRRELKRIIGGQTALLSD